MKRELISQLRNKELTREAYRSATEKLGWILASEASSYLEEEEFDIETPLATATGFRYTQPIMIVPVLRSGLALLPPFLQYYPTADVGFVGLRRDEVTAIPHMYYLNLPKFTQDTVVFVLEPMIATGGSLTAAIHTLLDAGVELEQIMISSIIGAPEGVSHLYKQFPGLQLNLVQEDDALNDSKFILPGLGDFGDRYFGTEA